MARVKKINKVTDAEKLAIINNSVQNAKNQIVGSAAETKKMFVRPIVNTDGSPSALGVMDRIVEETEAALNEVDGNIEKIPLVVDEVLTLPVSHESIVVGYGNSIDLDSLNKTPQKDDRFWGICKSTDNYVYSFVAKCTGEITTNENEVQFAEFEFVELVLLHDANTDEIIDNTLVLKMVPEFNKPYEEIKSNYDNYTDEEYAAEQVYSIWYDNFNKRPEVGDLFVSVGTSNDGYVFAFKARVVKATNTIWFAFDDLVLLHNASTDNAIETIPLVSKVTLEFGKTFEYIQELYTNGSDVDAFKPHQINRAAEVGERIFAVGTTSDGQTIGFTAEITGKNDAGNFTFKMVDLVVLYRAPLMLLYTLEPNATAESLLAGYSDSAPISAFNRRPLINELFYSTLKTPYKEALSLTAKVTGYSVKDGVEYAKFQSVEILLISRDNIKLTKVVSALPEVGEEGKIYFVTKGNGAGNDLFDEHIWVNKGTEDTPEYDWEYIGTRQFDVEIDLAEYVKFTDYATADKAGVVFGGQQLGINVNSQGKLNIMRATNEDIDAATNTYRPIVANNYKYAVKKGITTNTETLTDEEKASACDFVGAVKKLAEAPKVQSVYGVTSSGEETSFPLNGGANENSICFRNANGQTSVAAPTADAHAANRGFVVNLPDNLTLTDDEKAKWRRMSGALSAWQHVISNGTLVLIMLSSAPLNIDTLETSFYEALRIFIPGMFSPVLNLLRTGETEYTYTLANGSSGTLTFTEFIDDITLL